MLLGCCYVTFLLDTPLEPKNINRAVGFGGKCQLLVYADVKFIAVCTHYKQVYRISIIHDGGKVKMVKLFLPTPFKHMMGLEVWLHSFSASVLDGGE
jgi:hypothetical protein